MALEDKTQQVKQQFAQKGIRLDDEWLNGCVQFFVEENPTISIAQLFQQAEEQWELSDLSDSGIKCLPNSIFDKKESHTINGTFPLQMQFLLDISESPYDQLQRIQDKETEVGKEQPEFKQTYQKSKKKRMLKLELTDGFRTVSALEFSPIPILNTHLLPGLKVLVSGPLRCVNHILFLEAKHIKILGGEVATFTIENAYENVLRKKLEQPINPNPRTEYQESAVAAESNASNQLNGIPSIPMTAANSAIRSNAISSRNQFNIIDDFPDDDFLNDIDIDEIASNAVNGAAPPVHASSARHDDTIPPIRRNTLLFDDMDDNDFLNIDSNIDLIGVAPKTETVQSDARSEVSTRSESSTRSEVIDTAMNSAFLTSPASSISADKYQFKIRGLNLATIKQLTECSPQDRYRRKHFIVKAFIENVAQKVRIAKKQWKLNVRLGDDLSANVTMEAAMSPDVLDKLAKISGREVSQMYAKKEENPQLEDELGQIIERLSTTLDDLDAFMKIEFDASAPFPVVVEVIDKAPVLERKLQEKIQHERLS